MSLLENPWVVGIGGGILSGLIVTFVTRCLFARRDNREYMQKVVTANQEVLYALRPGISEGIIPSPFVFESVIAATARKYGVDRGVMYSDADVVDVLTKEVMDSSFISATSKASFCDKLGQIKVEKPVASAKGPTAEGSVFAEYRYKMLSKMSLLLGAMTTFITMAFVGLKGVGLCNLSRSETPFLFAFPMVIVVFFLVFAWFSSFFVLVIKNKIRQAKGNETKSTFDVNS